MIENNKIKHMRQRCSAFPDEEDDLKPDGRDLDINDKKD